MKKTKNAANSISGRTVQRNGPRNGSGSSCGSMTTGSVASPGFCFFSSARYFSSAASTYLTSWFWSSEYGNLTVNLPPESFSPLTASWSGLRTSPTPLSLPMRVSFLSWPASATCLNSV